MRRGQIAALEAVAIGGGELIGEVILNQIVLGGRDALQGRPGARSIPARGTRTPPRLPRRGDSAARARFQRWPSCGVTHWLRGARLHAVLEPIAQPLHAAAKRVVGQAKHGSEPAAVGNLRRPLAFVVAQEQRLDPPQAARPGSDRSSRAGDRRPDRRRRGRRERHLRHVVDRGECRPAPPLQRDQPRDAMRVLRTSCTVVVSSSLCARRSITSSAHSSGGDTPRQSKNLTSARCSRSYACAAALESECSRSSRRASPCALIERSLPAGYVIRIARTFRILPTRCSLHGSLGRAGQRPAALVERPLLVSGTRAENVSRPPYLHRRKQLSGSGANRRRPPLAVSAQRRGPLERRILIDAGVE